VPDSSFDAVSLGVPGEYAIDYRPSSDWEIPVAHSAQGLRRYSDWSGNPSTFATRSIYEPLARYISPYKMETEPSALDHTSTVVLDTTPLVLVLSPPHWVSPNTSSDKSERLRVPVLVCGTPRSDPSSRDRIRDKVIEESYTKEGRVHRNKGTRLISFSRGKACMWPCHN